MLTIHPIHSHVNTLLTGLEYTMTMTMALHLKPFLLNSQKYTLAVMFPRGHCAQNVFFSALQ